MGCEDEKVEVKVCNFIGVAFLSLARRIGRFFVGGAS